MKRREFIGLVGGAAAAWPLAARAQQPALPLIGFLYAGAAQPSPGSLNEFRSGLSEQGYVEGRTVAIEVRATEQNDQLPMLVGELVRRQVAVIFALGTTNSAVAAKAATATIPIVFANGGDPVALGLVASTSRPGGNVTGVSFLAGVLLPKRLDLQRKLVPQAVTIGFLVNPTNSRAEADQQVMQEAARSVGQNIVVLNASTETEIDTALATAARQGLGGLIVDGDAFYNNQAAQLATLSVRYRIPTNYPARVGPDNGGLMSYGDDRRESYREAGVYAGRILKGEKPADLPVLLPAKFEFVINLKSAKALALEIPPTLLALADEVIE